MPAQGGRLRPRPLINGAEEVGGGCIGADRLRGDPLVPRAGDSARLDVLHQGGGHVGGGLHHRGDVRRRAAPAEPATILLLTIFQIL